MLARASSSLTDGPTEKLIGKIYIQTHRQQGDLVTLILFFQNKESRPKIIKKKYVSLMATSRPNTTVNYPMV
jgi:hypothetical protein